MPTIMISPQTKVPLVMFVEQGIFEVIRHQWYFQEYILLSIMAQRSQSALFKQSIQNKSEHPTPQIPSNISPTYPHKTQIPPSSPNIMLPTCSLPSIYFSVSPPFLQISSTHIIHFSKHKAMSLLICLSSQLPISNFFNTYQDFTCQFFSNFKFFFHISLFNLNMKVYCFVTIAILGIMQTVAEYVSFAVDQVLHYQTSSENVIASSLSADKSMFAILNDQHQIVIYRFMNPSKEYQLFQIINNAVVSNDHCYMKLQRKATFLLVYCDGPNIQIFRRTGLSFVLHQSIQVDNRMVLAVDDDFEVLIAGEFGAKDLTIYEQKNKMFMQQSIFSVASFMQELIETNDLNCFGTLELDVTIVNSNPVYELVSRIYCKPKKNKGYQLIFQEAGLQIALIGFKHDKSLFIITTQGLILDHFWNGAFHGQHQVSNCSNFLQAFHAQNRNIFVGCDSFLLKVLGQSNYSYNGAYYDNITAIIFEVSEDGRIIIIITDQHIIIIRITRNHPDNNDDKSDKSDNSEQDSEKNGNKDGKGKGNDRRSSKSRGKNRVGAVIQQEEQVPEKIEPTISMKVGIGVGVSLGVLIVILGILLLLKKKKYCCFRRKVVEQNPVGTLQTISNSNKEFD